MLSTLLVHLLDWFHREEGQDLIEYALITTVISVAIIVGLIVTPLGTAFQTWVENMAAAING